MELNEFIENFANQLEDTELSILTPNTKFRELDEWSSLTALSIQAMIDEEYDVLLKPNEMRKANTLQELYELVKQVARE